MAINNRVIKENKGNGYQELVFKGTQGQWVSTRGFQKKTRAMAINNRFLMGKKTNGYQK